MTAAATPPYSLTTGILHLVEQIGEAIGLAEAAGQGLDFRLRREARVRTVHGSVAIEGNALSEEQVSAILDGKRVAGPLRDVQEVRNAIAAYDRLESWEPSSEADLLAAHGLLMAALMDAPGRYRTRQVGVVGPSSPWRKCVSHRERSGARPARRDEGAYRAIFDRRATMLGGMHGRSNAARLSPRAATAIHHIGPPAKRVPELMAALLAWLETTQEHPLIASSVFHYEFEFIHPFEDGNGRLGRLWQTLILHRWKPLFAHVPVESVVRDRQNGYYEAIEQSSEEGGSTPFIHFMLNAVLDAVREGTPQETPQETPQVDRLLRVLNGEMSVREVLEALSLRDRKWLRQAYLAPALKSGLIEMTRPEAPSARNQRYRLTPAGRRVRDTHPPVLAQ